MSNPRSIEYCRECIRISREILSQAALRIFDDGEIQPGKDINTDEPIDQWVRQNVARVSPSRQL